MRGRADLAPTMEWVAEQRLVSVLKSELRRESLLVEPVVYSLDESALRRYERRVLVR